MPVHGDAVERALESRDLVLREIYEVGLQAVHRGVEVLAGPLERAAKTAVEKELGGASSNPMLYTPSLHQKA